jgi:hypothetical protein
VVGRRNNILGGLSRTALRRGVHEHAATQMGPGSVLGSVVAALLLTGAGLMRFAIYDRNRSHGR